jgi:hypothetical protein
MEILDLLKKRLAQAEDDVRRLRAAVAELERDELSPPATHRPPGGSGGRPATRTATPEQLLRLIPGGRPCDRCD